MPIDKDSVIINKIINNGGVIQNGVYLELSDNYLSDYKFIIITDNGFTQGIHNDEELKQFCPDSDYFK